MIRKTLFGIAAIIGVAVPAHAQLDPLLFIKDTQPYVLFVVDTGNRMQRDAPTDPANSQATSNYYDPYLYPRASSSVTVQATLGVSDLNTNTTGSYRRKYTNFTYTAGGTDKANTGGGIVVTGDKEAAYASFEAATRMSIARAAMYQAVLMNQNDAQFGLLKTRQKNGGSSIPSVATAGNYSPVTNSLLTQSVAGTTEVAGGKWNMSRPTVSADNGSNNSVQNPLIDASDDGSAADLLTLLAKDMRTSGALLPAGNDTSTNQDTPIKFMLDDAFAAADDLIHHDDDCTNTIVVLIVGGGEGNTAGNTNATMAARASAFLNVRSSRRVPIYVIAIAPPTADVASLKLIASNSGGKYIEITKAMIDAALARNVFPWTSVVGDPAGHPNKVKLLTQDASNHDVYVDVPLGTVIVPEMVQAINTAIQHGMADAADVNTAPSLALPYGPISEFQVTSPVIGTVNLENAKDINGGSLPNTIVLDKAGQKIPQRSNLLVTTALLAPGFNAGLRGFRQYKPAVDATQPSGYKFNSDGTRLWIAKVPTNNDGSVNAAVRNLYTAKTDGTIIPFNTSDAGNLATIATMMGTINGQVVSVADATTIINYIRGLPLGPIVSSTPAIMNPPSLDPPPDDDYPGFASANKDRRSIIWVGTNYGILEGIDARLGTEVWGFIPPTLLPKLNALKLGQGVTNFMYFVDGSAKIADVKVDGAWHSHLIMGQGDGGSFYQSFDVTMPHMSDAISPTSDSLTDVLAWFADPTRIAMNWAFPKYVDFDPTLTVWDNTTNSYVPWGDLKSTAPAIEKSVGHTWSDPAVGQIKSEAGPFAVLIGSGFMPYSTQQQANRGGAIAGTTFYLLNAKDGTVYDSKDVGSDAQNENIDDCAEDETPSKGQSWFRHHLGKKKKWFGCNKLKNALQSDPVATGPADSRFITMAYMGDLDGRVWRFDIGLDNANKPKVNANVKLWETGQDQPIFASMATINVGGANQYIFYSTGSDLLPSTNVNTKYQLLGLLDNGSSGTITLDQTLDKVNDRGKDEKVTSFPAVAGDIVFFTTTDFRPANGCKAALAKLWAFRFDGGPAYDSSGDNKVDSHDTPLIASISGERATAPFIVDQHLVFGTASGVKIFGDSTDYNNGIGQAGVRILSWREVR